MLFSPMFSKYI